MSDTPKAAGELPTPILLGEGLSLDDIWQSLHASERTWGARSSSAPRFAFEDMVWGSDRVLMDAKTFGAALTESVGGTTQKAAARAQVTGVRGCIIHYRKLYRRLRTDMI